VSESGAMRLRDGRDLGYLEWGAPDGAALLAFHGTPGTRRQLAFEDAEATSRSLRCVCLDRPGYGLSSFHDGRTYTSWARDVEEFADRRGIGEFLVLGLSGGGPHALACAAVLGERVRATAAVSSVPPGWVSPLPRLDVRRLVDGARRRGGAEVRIRLARRSPSRAVDRLIRRLTPVDAAIVARPEVRRRLEVDAAEGSSTVARSVVQDRALWEADWGFDLDGMGAAVQLWCGTEDRYVPIGAAQLLRTAMPSATFRELAGAGHFFIFERFWQVVDELRTGVQWP